MKMNYIDHTQDQKYFSVLLMGYCKLQELGFSVRL